MPVCLSERPEIGIPTKPSAELADIFRDNLDKLPKLSVEQWNVVNAIISCRTSRLGGHLLRCDQCDHELNLYNSCRNRHCPKCQALARAQWLSDRMTELLPVPYFHVVFTIPDFLNPVALRNKAVFYNILFRATNETLQQAALNPRNLGARIGFLAILHTWAQNLQDHPHIHCVVPGGGLSPDGSQWISSSNRFFVHVKILGKLFRGKVLDYLKTAFQDQQLHFPGKIQQFQHASAFQRLIDRGYRKQWVVYAKRPFAGPAQVLKYLANYTHRIAISNHRILKLGSDSVTFSWKDRKHNNITKQMSLGTREFMRRFLLHVLPKRFVRIRSYGLLCNRYKKELLNRCRVLIPTGEHTEESLALDAQPPGHECDLDQPETNDRLCPKCRTGHMIEIGIIEPQPIVAGNAFFDTS